MSDVITQIPLYQRINFRLITFVAVVLLIVGYPAWVFIDSELSGGMYDAGNGYTAVDLKALSSFSFDQNVGRLDDIPKQWRDLNGKKVVLEGEIAPTGFSARNFNGFDLCYSVQKCCFSGPPQVQHFVQSRLPEGDVVQAAGLVRVKGVLHVDVKQGDGKVDSIYQLDVESVDRVM
ncbi:MAG TPA: hypothetical protein VHD56_12060 [Tepidisphaeraceae bacterium]|nr:hypothetical protein [Tepidisphaeraceae bacterium]